ncbi:MAG: GNAT family N-acetyltransferase [Defluviitaleaceae bacterium]|nr:GNAT family N-acetyltransferase [Defluviitaleaceae bacterium]
MKTNCEAKLEYATDYVKLIFPDRMYVESYIKACMEFKAIGLHLYSFNDPDTSHEWKDSIFERYEDNRNGVNLKEGYVPSSTFWLVDEERGIFLGEGNVRHNLTPPLINYGGHVGYAIRHTQWGNGYGTLLCSLLLREAVKLGIKEALITCDDNNHASRKVIERNGGMLENIVPNIIDGMQIQTRRYWVDLEGLAV